MNMKVLNIHEFSTKSGNNYIFDNSKGLVIPSTDSIRYIIENYYKGKELILHDLMNDYRFNEKEALKEYNYVDNLINLGHFYTIYNDDLLTEDDCEKLLLNSPCSQLILIVTEECNMRCKYCVYSNQYPSTKSYSNKKMDFETAKKAIDEYMKIFLKKKECGLRGTPKVSFYGGEPFLEYKLIKQVVEYCNKRQLGAEYIVTTNGTIMNDDIIDLIVDNNFMIAFSIDGFKENHDRNRVFSNEKGTFDIIIKNIEMLERRKLESGKNEPITFICCYDSFTNMEEVINFFEKKNNKSIQYNMMFNQVYKYGTTYYDYCNTFYEDNNYSFRKDNLATTVKKLRDKYLYNELNGIEQTNEVKFLFKSLTYLNYRYQGYVSPIGNACVPGDKIAVDSNGDFYLCEKATQQNKIGDINIGLDIKRATKVINEFREIRSNHCKGCTLSRLCDLCYVHLLDAGNLKFNEQFCRDKKKDFNASLSTLYSVLEKNKRAFYLEEKSDNSYDICKID